MTSDTYYIQCLLIKHVKDGFLRTIIWLPENFAEYEKVLKFKREDGSWSNGWVVQETYGRNTKQFVLEHERDFTRQREASDI